MSNLSSSAKDIKRLRGQVERVTFHNQENGWSVIKLREETSSDSKTVVGHFPSIKPGEIFELFGNWIHHKQFGLQFKAERSVSLVPDTEHSLIRYLSSGLFPGMGEKTAQKVVQYFKDDTLDILNEDPYRLTEIPGIGKSKSLKLIKFWNSAQDASQIMMFLSKYDISPLFAARIYKNYKSEAIDTITENPYQLSSDIRGIGFQSADQLALKMGFPGDSHFRIKAAISYIIEKQADSGHCYLTKDQIIVGTSELLKLDKETLFQVIDDVLIELEHECQIIKEIDYSSQNKAEYFFSLNIFTAEKNVSHRLKCISQQDQAVDLVRVEKWIDRYASAMDIQLSEEQIEAVKKSVCYPVFILTGGPGVGKTTTANTIIRLQLAMGKQIHLAAPTGRAAKRLTEVSGREAKTIHRLLEWNPGTGGFSRDEENPLLCDTLIVDEASMIDIRLASALVSAISNKTQVIFIGDTDQLPSVGPGNFLGDMINSDAIPNIELTKIFRQAETSKIIHASHQINQGILPTLENKHGDFLFKETQNSDETISLIEGVMRDSKFNQYKFNSKKDVQILTPVHKGDLGTENLNKIIQEIFSENNLSLFSSKEHKLLPGDKVIQSSNNYDLGVFNGDIGYIVDDNTTTKGNKRTIKVQYEDHIITYENEQIFELKLAYAITIHKSQGSEFPVVVMPISMSHYMMLKRNLLYTGITRGAKLVILIGNKEGIQKACDTEDNRSRQTRLAHKLTTL